MIQIKDYKISGKCENCESEYYGLIDQRFYVICPKCAKKTSNYVGIDEFPNGEIISDLIQIPNKYSNDLCKNKNITQNKYLEWVNIGCRNLKRNGSSWCDKCAEDYHNGVETKFEQPVEKESQSLIDNDGSSLAI